MQPDDDPALPASPGLGMEVATPYVGARSAARKKRQIRRELGNLPKRSIVLIADETDLLLFPPLRAMWSPRSVPAQVTLGGGNAKRVVFGCMNLMTGHHLYRTSLVPGDASATSSRLQAFLLLLRRHYRGWQVTMAVDRHRSHDAHASQVLAACLDIRLLWFPKRQGKDAICANKQFTSIANQVAAFIEHVNGLLIHQALPTSGVLSQQFWLRHVAGKKFSKPA